MKRLLRPISASTQNNDFEISNGKLIKYNGNAANVVIPDGVTSIGDYAFFNCKSLKSITIPNSVTRISKGMFEKCTNLTSITIPDSVTSIGDWAFSNCESLKSITIPDSVTSIGKWAFGGCTNLASVTIPDSVTSIGRYAFDGCKKLPQSVKNYIPQGGKDNSRKDNSRKANSKKVILYCAYKLWGRAYSGGVSDVTVTGNSLADAIWKVSEYVTGVNSRLEDFVYDYCDKEGIEIPDNAYAEDFISEVPDAELIDFMKENEWEEEWQIFVLLNETTHEFYIGEEFKDDPYNTQDMDKDDWDASNDEYDDEDEWV